MKSKYKPFVAQGDSASEARRCLKNESSYTNRIISGSKFYPDPQADYVWLMINHRKQIVVVIYLHQADFESCDYDQFLLDNKGYRK